MKTRIAFFLMSAVAIFLFSCNTESDEVIPQIEPMTPDALTSASNRGATQISGIGYFDLTDQCDFASQGADFAALLTGDLEGCLYIFVESFQCSPSGTYRETGRELFIGTYMGVPGTFETNYRFTGKYEECADGLLSVEIFGRCQHPIVKGSGTGVFDGVSGRIDFKDNVETGELPYRGHLKF